MNTQDDRNARKAGLGKAYRQGITLIEFARMFPDEATTRTWFEQQRWLDGTRVCPQCESPDMTQIPHAKPMPYRCRACKKFFSVRTGAALEQSKVPLQKWAFAIYLCVTSLKGVSSMKLHRDPGVTQKTAWFMAQRIRQAWEQHGEGLFSGPVEVDETYVGDKEKNKHGRKKLKAGRCASGKATGVGIKDRDSNASMPRSSTAPITPLHGFVTAHIAGGAKVYTDDHRGYAGLPNHESVRHSVNEYVRDQAHTNGIESFWATLKRWGGGRVSWHVPQDERQASPKVRGRVRRAARPASGGYLGPDGSRRGGARRPAAAVR